MEQIPFVVFESETHRLKTMYDALLEQHEKDLARTSHEKKRWTVIGIILIGVCVLLAAGLIVSQAIWIKAWNDREAQFQLVETTEETITEEETVTYDVVQDNENGTNNFNGNVIGNEGDVNYGAAENQSNEDETAHD